MNKMTSRKGGEAMLEGSENRTRQAGNGSNARLVSQVDSFATE